jgi:murein DD-endopeptidase MepM/ murein hydrolase activator NlpD
MMVRKRLLPGVALFGGLVVLATLPGASGQGLRSRLQANREQKQAVQERLQVIKAEQDKRRGLLNATRRQTARAKEAYNTAKSDLEDTRDRRVSAQKQLRDCETRLKRHDAAVCSRLKAMYEIGEPSYLEVLLNATTFSDFVERADNMQRIAEQDANLLIDYVNQKKAAEKLRNQLLEQEAREAEQARALYRKKAEYESQASKVQWLLLRANSERAAAERELAELEQASNEIAEMLRRVQSGAEGTSARYSGSWSGWGSAPITSGYRFSSGFGWRIHPITGRRSFHDGVDMACGYGTPIHAAAAGLVIHAGWYGPYGIAVVIDHGSGWGTLYGHCSSLAVSAGQSVSAGQVIGYVGSTGYSTGPHLHYSVRRNGSPVAPF